MEQFHVVIWRASSITIQDVAEKFLANCTGGDRLVGTTLEEES